MDCRQWAVAASRSEGEMSSIELAEDRELHPSSEKGRIQTNPSQVRGL